MLNPSKQIIETRLHSWKLFFESAQSEAMGHGALLSGNDPRLVYVGAPVETHCVDAVIDAAIASGDTDLIGLAELVDLHAENYLTRMDDELHAAMVQDDDDENYARVPRTGPPAVTMAELEAALAGK